QYAMLDSNAKAVKNGGLTIVVDPKAPGAGFGVAIEALDASAFESGAGDAEWAAALAAQPPQLALQGQVYRIATTGTAPETVSLALDVPPGSSADLLSVYAYDSAVGEWRFVPARLTGATLTATVDAVPEHVALFQTAPPSQPIVLIAVDVVQTLSPEVAQLATIVSSAGLQPTLEGTLTGSLAAGVDLSAGYAVMPVIRNFIDPRALDPQTVTAVLSNRALRDRHVTEIVNFASANGVDGVFIDYRDLPADSRDAFTAFVTALGQRMDRSGLALGVVVPAADNAAGLWDTGAYDWQALGQAVDYLQINLPSAPSAYMPGSDQLVEAMLRWAVSQVDRYKVLIGLSARSVREAAGAFTPIGYAEGLAGLGDVRISADLSEGGTVPPGSAIEAALDGLRAVSGYDTRINTPFVEYYGADGGLAARVWLVDSGALRFRMDRTVPFALGGVAFTDLLAPDLGAGVLESVLNYKLQIPDAPADRQLALRWRIESAFGLLSEVTTSLNQPLVVTIEAPDGNYAVNVAVVDGAGEIPRSGAAVALFAPTATPTPPPTPTPTPEPTATPVPVAAVPQPQAAPSGGGGAAVRPGAGSIVAGNFEYGGHVTSTASDRAVAAMRQAGMTWMKVQVGYSPGQDPSSVAGVINDAKARGFKVLLGVVGRPADLAAGGAGYVQQFAQFLAGVAALGPDAIEVWNEPNLDREWPRGQISGAAYADMLRQAYQAIKATNGGVMVISGAPAPTGAEAAFPGQVVNDDNWLRDVVNAGGLQWMDCVGAHYNEGIIPPSQRSGDPRDGYYTRYFFGMLDTYWSIVGGQKPICFTELGYLTSAGYPPLPLFFSWASNVTLEQHAAWLAEAAALASQSGRVRLMIVWNVDFTRYDSDPMAGYAMIRADGSCPACSALAGAR
ncbi:MAG: hypothetical protein ACUVSX_03875, partial [Aggregatilineales bacterium]